MLRILVAVTLFLPVIGACGCSWNWQANHASEAVNINPFAAGSGEPAFTPANSPGYINGEPQDMRSKH
jgi:hypothetical protein